MHLKNMITAIDHHHGQVSRTIISGYPPIRGATMRAKAEDYAARLSWLHRALLREPRGHRNMLGSILTEPVTDNAAFGVLFLHPDGMFDACGDSTFATACAAVETGVVPAEEPVVRFTVDTVLGALAIEADFADGRVGEIRFRNLPARALGAVCVPMGDREIRLELAFGGLVYGFVEDRDLGIDLTLASEEEVLAAWRRLQAAMAGAPLALPDGPVTPDLITLTQRLPDCDGPCYLVANIYAPGRMGRTPSGTGTSAHMALRQAQGSYDPSTPFVQRNRLGITFTGRGVVTGDALVPTIGTRTHMVGIHQFVIDRADPFPEGFVLDS